MRPLLRLASVFVAISFLISVSAVAQKAATKPLITEKVDENNLVILKGNTPPAATAANDRGRVNPGMSMSGLILTLRRSPDQEAAFDAFIASQYDPTSRNYHEWLTPEQVGEKFGPSLVDIATVSAWLSGHGLTVEEVAKDRMTIRFSGTAAQVQGTFHTEIHNLLVKGVPHISNMSDPQIPMALEPVVLGPKALHNFLPRPLHRLGGKVTRNAKTGAWERVAGAGLVAPSMGSNSVRPRPEFGLTGGSGSNTYQIEDVSPYDFAAIYNVQPLWSNSIDGTGQTIAVAGTSDINLTDVSTFRSTFGLPVGLPPKIKVAHGTDPGRCTGTTGACTIDDQIENALDVEWSGAVAPGAQIVLAVSSATSANDDTVYDSAAYVVQNDVAKILNVSYGECELGLGTTNNATYNSLWKTAATGGIAVFVATGDSGSPNCDQGSDVQLGTPYTAQYGLSVNGLASTPYDTAVGGTDLNWGATASPYWNSTNNSSNGSSAKGYMPEVPWNDTCSNPLALNYFQQWAQALQTHGFNATSPTDPESACNFVLNWWQTIYNNTNPAVNISGFIDTIGAGGGESNCTTSDGATVASCTGGYATPSWQTGVTGIPTDGKRSIPDVSFFASNGFLGSAYLICVSDWGTCVTRTQTTEPSVGEIGGTSAATPAMAGVMALINQEAGSAQGNPNSGLYQLAAKQTYSSCKTETVTNSSSCYFNDIDTGTISMPCAYSTTASQNSPNCAISHTGDTIGLLTGYNAGVGYDSATGLGSLNVANVVNNWTTSVIGTGATTVTVAASPSTFTSQQGTTVTVTVSGSGGTPTGTIVLTSGSFTSASHTLASGATTFNLSPGVLAAGTDTITAAYSGDSTYAANTGTTQVTITAVSFKLTAQTPNPSSVTAGGSSTVGIQVASTNGYAGTVTLSCAMTSGPSGAIEPATCAPTSGQSSVTLSAATTSGTGQVTVSTTPAPSGAVKHVAKSGGAGWFGAAGGAALASLVLFFLPGSWSRRYRNVFCALLVMMAGSFVAIGCGGGGGGGHQKSAATVTVTPAKTSISETDSLSVTIAVAGSGSTTAPTGTVTLTSGSFSSSATTLSGGSATITIPAGKLAVGATDTLTASYSGDTSFNSATGSSTVQVNKAATTSGTYTFTVTGTDASNMTASTTFSVTVN